MCIDVRDLTDEEGNRLKGIIRRSNDAFNFKRAQVILASAQSMKVPEIRSNFGFSGTKVIHDFNKTGFTVIEPKYNNFGKGTKFSKVQRQTLVDIASSKPANLSLSFTEWSLTKLRDHIIGTLDIDSVSIETIRRILKERGINYRRTKTWKESNDPDFEDKKTNRET
jgi:transposase